MTSNVWPHPTLTKAYFPTTATLGVWLRVAIVFLTVWLGLHGRHALANTPNDPIYLYSASHSAEAWKEKGSTYSDTLGVWRRYLKKFGSEAKELSKQELLSLPGGRSVLILASAIALDQEEKQAIDRLARQGTNLLGTGFIGTLGPRSTPIGLDFLHRTFRVKTHGEFTSDDGLFLMPFGDSPISWPVPAGRRMDVGGDGKSGAIRVESGNLAAVMLGWDRIMDTQVHGVLAYDESSFNRVVYSGLPENAWPSKKNGLVAMHAILDASIAWLRRKPQAFRAAWPEGKRAAHLIEMDTEDKYYAATNLAQHLEQHGFRGTFYSLTSEAVKYPDVVKDLKRRGHEIAYHADVHFGFGKLPAAEQELRIQFMIQQMRGILGNEVKDATGFRAPTESYDHTTEMLLRKHGMEHHAADPAASEDRLPFFSIAEAGVPPSEALVVLPRTQWDDVNFTYMRLTPDAVSRILAFDLDLNFRSGAFSLLSVHSQYYVDGALMHGVMADYVRKVAAYGDKLWVARGDAIAKWWRNRAQVRATQTPHADGIQLTLDSAVNVKGFTILVTLPHANAPIQWLPAEKLRSTPVRIQNIDAQRTALVFEQLSPGQVKGLIQVH